jgi:hypothetical protein
MKKTLILFLTLLSLGLIAQELYSCKDRKIICNNESTQISGHPISYLGELINKKITFQVIDLRPAAMFSICNIAGSLNLEFPATGDGAFSKVNKLFINQMIAKGVTPVIICSTCNRSANLMNEAICNWKIKPDKIVWIYEGINFLKQSDPLIQLNGINCR